MNERRTHGASLRPWFRVPSAFARQDADLRHRYRELLEQARTGANHHLQSSSYSCTYIFWMIWWMTVTSGTFRPTVWRSSSPRIRYHLTEPVFGNGMEKKAASVRAFGRPKQISR